MRNSDKVTFVCFTNGGARGNGKTIGTKIRFTNDRTRYTKALGKLGVSSVVWVDLPNAMTKPQAIDYLRASSDVTTSEQAYQDAIAAAARRFRPTKSAAKTAKTVKNSK
jgi:LmbE family N-acetylglucosaminyl deacetylase